MTDDLRDRDCVCPIRWVSREELERLYPERADDIERRMELDFDHIFKGENQDEESDSEK